MYCIVTVFLNTTKLTVFFVWMLANAGGVLHFTSTRLDIADLESAYAASFAGSLILTVFGVSACTQ